MRAREERGSFTIEATLSLSIFMFAFVTIISLATVAKIESTTQYAINQTAKEVSRYCYIASKANLLVNPSDGSEAKVDNIDDAIQSMYDFSDVYSGTTGSGHKDKSVGNSASSELSAQLTKLSKIDGDDFEEIKSAAQNVYSSFKPLLDDPKGAIKAITEVFLNKGAKAVISRVIAQPLCETIVPKYITSNEDVDETLEKMGVIDGLDGLDFSMSTFLMDGRTINIVVVYKIKVNGYGVFDQEVVVKQTASTAAWLANTDGNTLKDVNSGITNWQKSNFERGKEYVNLIQNESPSQAVKEGVGIDLYSQEKNTFKSVHSINVFSATYSDYQKNGTESNVEDYALKKSKIKSVVKGYANTLLKKVEAVDEMIIMEDGTECQTAKNGVKDRKAEIILVVPEEAKSSSKTLNEIVSEIESETGVKVSITYRDKALGGS